jgi:site-specific recombinase XerD
MQNQNAITAEAQAAFAAYLKLEEKAGATIEKYGRDIRAFTLWLGSAAVTKEAAADYKKHLLGLGRVAAGVNAVIAALNAFFGFMGWEIKLKPLKIQRQTFRDKSKELNKDEYARLLNAAKSKGNERLNLVIQAICSTGIRVSELRFITVEAVKAGMAEITSKGKTRTVFIPKKLKPLLLSYAKGRGTLFGCIFITKSGRPLDRSNIWAEMKKLCDTAGVEASKVFPHSLRSLFARLFYEADKDIIRLADILGHSSVDTTRIYLMESGEQHRKRVDALGLVIT